MWASMIRLLGGKGERAGVATAMAAEERLQQRRSAVARVNGAIETAASRMTQLEEDFLAFKHHGTYHAERHTEGAVRCAKMEAIMMDVEDGVLELRNKAVDEDMPMPTTTDTEPRTPLGDTHRASVEDTTSAPNAYRYFSLELGIFASTTGMNL